MALLLHVILSVYLSVWRSENYWTWLGLEDVWTLDSLLATLISNTFVLFWSGRTNSCSVSRGVIVLARMRSHQRRSVT